MNQTISVEVENYGVGGEGPGRAGMAIVRLNGEVVAKLRTLEGIEFSIGGPTITTGGHHPRPDDYGIRKAPENTVSLPAVDDLDAHARAREGCPDGGTCHHSCDRACWRVFNCGPLSIAGFGDRWPQEVRQAEINRQTEQAGD